MGVYNSSSEGGCLAEFTIRWHELSNKKISPKLEVFDDAWEVFLNTLVTSLNKWLLSLGKIILQKIFAKF